VERTVATWRFVVAYQGRRFKGWQAQDGERTVQGVLAAALSQIANEPVTVRAAGRTDAGVHARGQVVSARFSSRIPPHKMILASGSVLPDDVAIVRAEQMPEGFDAKRYSTGKRYCYRVHNRAWNDPFRTRTSWHVKQELDVDAMRTAAALFVGEHDFESFRAASCEAAHARRYIWRSSIDVDDGLLTYEVRGNAFCRYMVRTLAGTLVDVGKGRFTPDDVTRMILARDRRSAGMTAPALGLTLEEVYYPDALAHADIPADARFPGYPVTDEDWPPRPRSEPALEETLAGAAVTDDEDG
jgi:tRNA pseudouridine38-40 synthase